MCKSLFFYGLMAMLFFCSINGKAQVYATQRGIAIFNAKMPINSYSGESNDLQGTINFETNEVAFKVLVKSIKTGNNKRDRHMYKLLQVENFPEVVFKGKLIGDFDLNKRARQELKVNGNFTLAGTTRNVSIPIELNPIEEGIELNASWFLLISNYNLERPSIAFIKVDDKHDLNIDALLKKK
ncbi:YceI-like domain-containing protein [Gillisia sp. Hel_I_86]|uniref:YceI family protein n=1 Tax=Gillisia sp. Hel_I_86 TaxID=1249981 RepID=UPI0011996483|nr:YceI family protein [Gillisia sp. Hel_I_86]TVZ27167.1 YceI-like domain-containing protein [Gillisia sp. Hel_I_86]